MITATVLTKNSADTLRGTLDSLSSFSEVLVLDSGSTDDTITIAKKYPNVTVHTSPFLGFGPMHNYASKLTAHDWILSIDSDEILSDELIREIHALPLDPNSVYSILRHNHFNGKRIKGCAGWHPDWVIRLYNKTVTAFSSDMVHEKVLQKECKIVPLKGPILHTPYNEVDEFLTKMQRYSTLYADQSDPEYASLTQALFHGWHAFMKSYFFKKGFRAGREGFIISLFNAHTTYYKYLKLVEKKNKQAPK